MDFHKTDIKFVTKPESSLSLFFTETFCQALKSDGEDFHKRHKNFTKPLIFIDSNFTETFRQTLRVMGLAYFHKGHQFLFHSFNHYTSKNMRERERESKKTGEFVERNWILNNIWKPLYVLRP